MTAIVTREETEAMGNQIGGNEFLAKPVKAEELIATIERVLAED
jgi:DNA-binding response OmpR family regulator